MCIFNVLPRPLKKSSQKTSLVIILRVWILNKLRTLCPSALCRSSPPLEVWNTNSVVVVWRLKTFCAGFRSDKLRFKGQLLLTQFFLWVMVSVNISIITVPTMVMILWRPFLMYSAFLFLVYFQYYVRSNAPHLIYDFCFRKAGISQMIRNVFNLWTFEFFLFVLQYLTGLYL